jgi:hypothetical protein
MLYGKELVKKLEEEIATLRKSISDRYERIDTGLTDMDDCFISQRFEERAIRTAKEKIDLINNGGCDWFVEYATLDNVLVEARWCKTEWGSSLRVKMPDGKVVWTTARTEKGLAKKGLKKVLCLRPAWFKFSSNGTGMFGAYTGDYVTFPSDVNYATGEKASDEPIEIAPYEY